MAEKGGHVLYADNLIVGGNQTTIERFPYIVSYQNFGAHRCGANIISETRLITAAHCAARVESTTVRAGSTDQRQGGVVSAVTCFLSHPDYNPRTLDNDVAIIEINPLTIGLPGIASIRLPVQDEYVEADRKAEVVGWGAACERCPSEHLLRYVAVPIVSNEDCNVSYGGGILDSMICAGFPEGGRDACQGDSGGPLILDGQLIGVVSWGHGCARPFFPGVYARAATFTSWFRDARCQT